MKLRINGFAQHGKDTVANRIADKYGLIKPDASRVIARYLVTSRLPQGWYAGTLEDQIEAAYLDRVNHRTGWFNFVDTMGRTTLCEEVLKMGDIYCGERDATAFEETRHLFNASIWVSSKGRGLGPEPIGSCNITAANHDFIIENDGTLEELYAKVDGIMALLVSSE